jgi:uncharacterized RDD family membrane protein YckC
LKAESGPRLSAPGILRRLASMGYEALLLTGILIVFLILPQIVIAFFAHRVATAGALWIHLFLTLLAYFVWFWSHGGTLAMKTWKIRLLTHDGRPVRPAQALWRYLLCWPSLACGGIGLLWAIVDRDGQFLHDRIAGTRLLTG